MIDLYKRLPNSLEGETPLNVYQDLNKITSLLLAKYVELSTINLLSYLKENALEYKFNIKLVEDVDNNFYYFRFTCSSPEALVNKESNHLLIEKSIEEKVRATIFIPDNFLSKFYRKNNEITFINNSEGQERLIEFMIGEKWQEWKKEGEIIDHYESLHNQIPEKINHKQNKNKL